MHRANLSRLFFELSMIPAIQFQNHAITLGKYRIAACPRALPSGRFAAQVSVASGVGSASTDRVICFTDDFATLEAAASFSMAQGLDWVQGTHRSH
jgi:hypothetical protein